MERGSFQSSVNERVYRGLQQRLHEIERILREDVTVNELTRAKNLLHIVSNHTANLQTALSQECWRRIDNSRLTLEEAIEARLELLRNATVPELPEYASPRSHENVGRPEKRIDRDKLSPEHGLHCKRNSKQELVGL